MTEVTFKIIKHAIPKYLTLLTSLLVIFFSFYIIASIDIFELIPEYYRPFSRHAAKIILIHNNGFGERETIARLRIAAARLNIDLRDFSESKGLETTHDIRQRICNIIKVFKPDFLLVLEDSLEYYPGVPNYVALTRGGNNKYIETNKNGTIQLKFKNLNKFDALLPSFENHDQIKIAFEANHKKFFDFPWYSLVYNMDYEPVSPRKLFYSGGHLWDDTRGSEKYLDVFKKLDGTGYFRVCGVRENWKHTPNSYIGQLPFDGKSVIEHVHTSGVSLLLHHKEHILGGAPTSRIFEAAAANAIIISDKHPFIMKYFGNNVLYIDTEQDAAGVFKQIDKHMKWIITHQMEAQRLAANCNAIFKSKFTLEQQLQNLLALHKEISASSRGVR